MGWADVSDDPNSDAALERRQSALNRAWRPDAPGDRLSYIEDRCRGRVVLDMGCTGHGGDMSRGDLLHLRIRGVAAQCVGVDYDREAVKRLQREGFDVHCFDVVRDDPLGLSPGRFDVVVAGEIIEHLRDPLKLLEAARLVLKDDGTLIVTTPNPYAPHRVSAGRSRCAWENADHLFYVFPAGVVEMADRAGLQLVEWFTLGWDDRRFQLRGSIQHWWNARRGRGIGRGPIKRPAWLKYVNPIEALVLWRQWRWGAMGETAVYTLQKKARAA